MEANSLGRKWLYNLAQNVVTMAGFVIARPYAVAI
jgi:hypothetical protein